VLGQPASDDNNQGTTNNNEKRDTQMTYTTVSFRRAVSMTMMTALLAGPNWGCGSSSSPSAPTPVAAVPTPTPCAQNVLFQSSGTMPAGTLLSQPTPVPAVGRLDITADWTLTTNPVGLYVVQGACSLDQFNARSCNFLSRVEPGAKPLKTSVPVQIGTYAVMLANYGTREDSGAIQIVLSTGSCAPAAVAPSSASSAATGNLQVQRVEMFR
jgi:hypothetical protein